MATQYLVLVVSNRSSSSAVRPSAYYYSISVQPTSPVSNNFSLLKLLLGQQPKYSKCGILKSRSFLLWGCWTISQSPAKRDDMNINFEKVNGALTKVSHISTERYVPGVAICDIDIFNGFIFNQTALSWGKISSHILVKVLMFS